MEECRRLGAKQAAHHGADLSDPNQIEDLFNYVKEKCGRGPDILVNNAGELFVHTHTHTHTFSSTHDNDDNYCTPSSCVYVKKLGGAWETRLLSVDTADMPDLALSPGSTHPTLKRWVESGDKAISLPFSLMFFRDTACLSN